MQIQTAARMIDAEISIAPPFFCPIAKAKPAKKNTSEITKA